MGVKRWGFTRRLSLKSSPHEPVVQQRGQQLACRDRRPYVKGRLTFDLARAPLDRNQEHKIEWKEGEKRVAGCCAEQSSAPPLNRFSSSSVTLQAMVKFSLAMSLIGLRHAAGSTQRISGRTEGCHWRWRTALVCSASMRQGIRGVPCLEPDHGRPGWGTGILQARE